MVRTKDTYVLLTIRGAARSLLEALQLKKNGGGAVWRGD